MNQDITVKVDALKPWSDRFPILKKPSFEAAALIETLIIGLKSLSYSAAEYSESEEERLTAKELVLTMALRFFYCGPFCYFTCLCYSADSIVY